MLEMAFGSLLSADLGGSSKYKNELLIHIFGLKWRRVFD